MQHLKGKLLVIEGPDGAGKSSVLDALLPELTRHNLHAKKFHFPGRDPGTLGELIYRIHHNHTEFGVAKLTPAALQCLHIAAHLDAIESQIVPHLAAGGTALMDRYWWSTWVYGRLNGANPTVVDTLIDAEKLQWGEHHPHTLVLIDRDNSLREDGEKYWSSLRSLYQQLAVNESRTCPVEVVRNVDSIQSTLQQILTLLAKS